MTRALDGAIAKLTTLPTEEQDGVGRWLFEELPDEAQWTRTFEASQDSPSKRGPAVRRTSIPTPCEFARDAASGRRTVSFPNPSTSRAEGLPVFSREPKPFQPAVQEHSRQ